MFQFNEINYTFFITKSFPLKTLKICIFDLQSSDSLNVLKNETAAVIMKAECHSSACHVPFIQLNSVLGGVSFTLNT
jgi:hypothetical protein